MQGCNRCMQSDCDYCDSVIWSGPLGRGVFLMATVGSSSRPHDSGDPAIGFGVGSPSLADQMPDLLPGRAIDCTT